MHKTFRRLPGHLLNALYTLDLRPMSRRLVHTEASVSFSVDFLSFFRSWHPHKDTTGKARPFYFQDTVERVGKTLVV